MRSHADLYNHLFEAVEDCGLGVEIGRGFKKIDFSRTEKLAEEEASEVVGEVVACAKMEMFTKFGDGYGAVQVLSKLLKTVWKQP